MGGRFTIHPLVKGYTSVQNYIDDTNVLLTEFSYNNEVILKVLDFMPICIALNRGILIPERKILDALLSDKFATPNGGSRERISRYSAQVNEKIRHIDDVFDMDHKEAASDAFFDAFYNVVCNLGDVISGKLPVVCFDQSVVLALLLNGDKKLTSAGFHANVQTGIFYNNDGYFGHAWVRLNHHKTWKPSSGIGRGKYIILDPARRDELISDCDGDATSLTKDNSYRVMYKPLNEITRIGRSLMSGILRKSALSNKDVYMR